ncbi:MAG: hypothetical protein M5R41_08960 [Bacteroidia bacterium]|nr:hypothetical protein [Bacteroidia bacterium]
MNDPALTQFTNSFRDTGFFLLAMLSTAVGVLLIAQLGMTEDPMDSFSFAWTLSCLILFVSKEQILVATVGRRMYGVVMLGFVSGTVTTLLNALFAA